MKAISVHKLTTERELQDKVIELAHVTGWLTYHTYDSRRSERGFPDLVLVRPPRMVVAELKAERGHLTDDQAVWMRALGECPGVEAYVWRPSDWDEIVRVLQ